jgi:hypothetical protein
MVYVRNLVENVGSKGRLSQSNFLMVPKGLFGEVKW